jgi:hypothetical protein
MMTQHPKISDQVEFISEALKETTRLVEDLNERYREYAFPIVLRGLMDGSFATKAPLLPLPGQNGDVSQSARATHLPPHLSVNEFFRTVNPTSHVGRFVCAAYYLLHVGQIEHFSMVDILEIYGKLRIKKPQNTTDTLVQGIRKAHIIDAPAVNGQKSWVITPNGEKYVEELLNGSTNAKKSAD